MARVREDIEFIASAQQLEAAGTVNGVAIDCSVWEEMSAILSVTASAGTNETLNVKFQVSNDGSIWADLGVAFTEATAVGTEYKAVTAPFGKWVRAVSVVGSGAADGDVTFSVVATGKMRP